MSKKGFEGLSQEECLLLYRNILENAERLWKDAEVMAGYKRYGVARSLLITSVEEQMKGLVLALDARGFEFRKVKGMWKIFRTHEIRHLLGYFMFGLEFLGKHLTDYAAILDQDEERAEQFKYFMNNPKKMGVMILQYFRKHISEIEKELEWFGHLENFRQEGYYVDFESQIIEPAMILEKDYQLAKEKLGYVKGATTAIIDAFGPSDKPKMLKLVNNIIDIMKTSKAYSSMEDMLSGNMRVSFFSEFVENITKFKAFLMKAERKKRFRKNIASAKSVILKPMDLKKSE